MRISDWSSDLCSSDLRIGLALHRLHRLADEEAEQRFLAALILRDLVGIGGKNLGNLGFDRAGVARLLEAITVDDRRGPVAALEHLFEHLLGDADRKSTRLNSSH